MKANKLYLFYPVTLLGWLISLVTRSPFSHAAIEVDGVLWDSSERRAYFGRSSINPSKRRHICIPFYGDLSGWLQNMQGRKYDWLGVLGWLFKANDKKKFYCFEAAWHALWWVHIANTTQPSRLSGLDLIKVIAAYFHRVPGGMAIGTAMQILYAVNFEHIKQLETRLAGRSGLDIAHTIIEVALNETGYRSVIHALEIIQADKHKLIRVEEQLYQLLNVQPTGAGVATAAASG